MTTTIETLREQSVRIEEQIAEFVKLGVDTEALNDALNDVESRISELEEAEIAVQDAEDREEVGEVRVRETGKVEPMTVTVYEGDTYVDLLERNGITISINGQERKVRNNRGAVENIMEEIDTETKSIFVGMPKIDGN